MSEYWERRFWTKVKIYANIAGRELLEKALLLYYVVKESDAPVQAKAIAAGALAYFIYPIDVIPDPFPYIGYSDDFLALALAVATLSVYITDGMKNKAGRQLEKAF